MKIEQKSQAIITGKFLEIWFVIAFFAFYLNLRVNIFFIIFFMIYEQKLNLKENRRVQFRKKKICMFLIFM